MIHLLLKMIVFKIQLLIFLINFNIFNCNDDLICSKDYCRAYVENGQCAQMPPMDETHQLKLLSPTTCNCCHDYKLRKLDKGAVCLLGYPGSILPTVICGDGLYCKLDTNGGDPTCQPITYTPCFKEQIDYDKRKMNGNIGNLEVRPECDRNGDYTSIWCIPGETCYCRNKQGARIFGTMLYSPTVKLDSLCQCARVVDKSYKKMSKFTENSLTVHCISNGNYDPLQCINNRCLCVDDKTGQPLDGGINQLKRPVSIKDINNANLTCFDKTIHKNGTYYRRCELDYFKNLIKINLLKKRGIELAGVNLPRCQPDGNYDQFQENRTSRYCTLPSGRIMTEYVVPKDSKEGKTMNCNCARATLLLDNLDAYDMPTCTSNGNYAPVQCRLNECRCVDTNGNQIGKEVLKSNVKQLPCYNSEQNN